MLRNNRFFFAEIGILIRTALLIAALVLLPETVDAVPLYYGSGSDVETVNASPNPVVLGSYFQTNDVDSEGGVIGVKTHGTHASASYGRGRGNSYADYLNVRPFFPLGISGTGAQESSSFALDDLVITGPPGNIVVSFNYSISGSIGGVTVATGNPAFYNWYTQGLATGGIGSSLGAGGFEIGRMYADFSGAVSRSGIFSTFPVNSEGTAMGTSPEISTYAGDTELGFSLGLETSASVQVGFGAEPGSSNSHATFNFGFPTSGPVANLPAGYTLNSADGRIVDNQFVVIAGDFDFDGDVDGRDFLAWQRSESPNSLSATDLAVWQANYGTGSIVATNIVVPEPATGALLWLALMSGLACRARNLKRTRATKQFIAAFALVTIIFLPEPARAVTTNFTNSSGGAFTTPSNWDSGVPDADDTAVFRRGSVPAYNVNFGNIFDPISPTIGRLIIGTNSVNFLSFQSSTLTVDDFPIGGGGVLLGGDTIIGQIASDVAVLNMNVDTTNFASLSTLYATLGNADGSVGTLNISGTRSFHVNGTGTGDELIVGASGAGAINIAVGADVTVADNAVLGRNATGAGNVSVNGNGSTLDVVDILTVGQLGSGMLNITGGGHVFSGDGEIGSNGSVTVSGTDGIGHSSAWINDGTLLIDGTPGSTGMRLLIEAGADVSSIDGLVRAGDVTVTDNASTWFIYEDLVVGDGGIGTLNVTNGGRVFNNSGSVGDQLGSIGTATVSGTDSRWSNSGDLTIAKFSQESEQLRTEMRIEAGGRVESANGLIAEEVNSSGIVTVSGKDEHGNRSTWDNMVFLTIGDKGKGSLLIENGGSVVNTIGRLGGEEGSTGDVTVTGADSTWSNSMSLGVGGGGTGTLNILDGGTVSNDAGTIRKGMVTVAGTDLDGNPSKWTNSQLSITAGNEHEAKLIIEGGGSVSAGFSNIGTDTGSYGAAVVTGVGSSWTNVQFFRVGDSGTGTLDVLNGGSVSSEGQGSVGEFGKGILTIRDGGTVSSQEGFIGQKPGVEGTVDISGAGSIWTNSQSLHVGFEGIGKLTVVNGGVAQAPLISINSQSSVHGDGTLLGDVTSEGLVSPGMSIGALHVDGDYSQSLDARLLIELASGASFDQLLVTGPALLSGTLEVDLLDGFVTSGERFLPILTAANVMGQFDTEVLPSVPNVTFDVIYNATSVVLHIIAPNLPGDFDGNGDVDGRDFLAWQRGGSPNPLSATDLADWQANYGTGSLVATSVAVPEPSSLLLLMLATAGRWLRSAVGLSSVKTRLHVRRLNN